MLISILSRGLINSFDVLRNSQRFGMIYTWEMVGIKRLKVKASDQMLIYSASRIMVYYN
jgi:hypothetical protein